MIIETSEKLNKKSILIKYGGNAMVDEPSRINFIEAVSYLNNAGLTVIISHGGGPFIGELLDDVGVKSEFIGGHRKTDETSMKYVEMALSGSVNNEIVKLLNQKEVNAVGLSGKDDNMVKAIKRFHESGSDSPKKKIDLGQVGDVHQVNTRLIEILVQENYLPVISPIGVGEDGNDYNINADMFAGHLAGSLKVDHYIVLTDVDGLYKDKDDPETLIHKLYVEDIKRQFGHIIKGGMIPKIESCLIALRKGAKRAHITNGMKSHKIVDLLLTNQETGTEILKTE